MSFAGSAASAAEPKRVMLLHSLGAQFGPWSEYAKAIRAELLREAPGPLDITEHSLVSARDRDETAESTFVEYLRALYARQPLDLIITLGAPAVGFVQRHRRQLFPVTPMVFTAVEQRRIQYSGLTENDVVVTYVHDFPAFFESILRVLPDIKLLAVVNGKSALEQFWDDEIRREAKAFEHRMTFRWYNELSFEDILKDAAALPPRSAIFWELMAIDAAGVVHEGDTALKRLHAVANAPIFSYQGAFFGREILGGPMHSVTHASERVVAAAIRILAGEKAGDIKFPIGGFSAARYNWQEMQRWGISESRLPPGSEIYFREPRIWDQYQLQILGIVAAFLLQAALICWLIIEHRRRHVAEIQSRSAISELTYMNRRASAGQLSATIAHEVSQPLTGISTRASAALRWLRAETPNLEKVGASLEQIVTASHRASDIVAGVRAMFRKDTTAKLPIDINNLILSVVAIVRIDLQRSGVELRTQLDEKSLVVEGDSVQLQQVVLNLVMNAIDAMRSVQPRVLTVKSEQSKADVVNISIEDTGTGIDPSNLKQVFSPLFTTKEHGMGMGLSICQSIIENHNGRIWVSPGVIRGVIFQFELPAKSGNGQADTMVDLPPNERTP